MASTSTQDIKPDESGDIVEILAASTTGASKRKRAVKPAQPKPKPKPKPETMTKPTKRTPAVQTEGKEINRLLAKAGVDKPAKKSKCVRAGLARGHFGFTFTGDAGQLDTVVKEEKCDMCDVGTLKATVRQLLEQADYGGDDYEDGSEGASIVCDNEKCGTRMYLTQCCQSPRGMAFDCGKFHNHCTKCKDLGICIGDYREAHCRQCGGHYYGFGRCPCKTKKAPANKRRKTGIWSLLGF